MPQAQQLGRYQLLDRIAFGGMAEIYRAKTFDSEGRARLVAVKRVLQHLTSDDDFIRMLVDEAKITAILDHPAIARVYEFSQSGEEYFIAMEYVDGKDVRAMLEKHRQLKVPLPPDHVAWIIAHVADGLNAAHTQTDADGRPMHIVHRDVSPSNILCSYQGDAKLCDFGIAKATLTRVQTRTGVIKGKVKYMSPEQAMGRKLDARSDLFSLGTVMYEMLTLEAPFLAQTEVELIFAVRDARKRDARELVPAIPEALNQILNRVMERQRTDRYQSGRELSRELFGFLERYSPAYRRGHLGRFMRGMFQEEIEKELRMLEGWVIEPGDASKVGVNLIADALPADAPYSTFSAASINDPSHEPSLDPSDSGQGELPAQRTGIYQREEHGPPPGDLHAEQTHIVGREAPARDRGELHAQSTMMLDGREAEALRERLHRSAPPPGEAGLHEQDTHIINNPAVAEPDSGERELPALPTQILMREEAPKAPPPARPRGKNDTSPDALPRRFTEDTGESTQPKAKLPPKVIADFSGEDDSGSGMTNPLSDSDLEKD